MRCIPFGRVAVCLVVGLALSLGSAGCSTSDTPDNNGSEDAGGGDEDVDAGGVDNDADAGEAEDGVTPDIFGGEDTAEDTGGGPECATNADCAGKEAQLGVIKAACEAAVCSAQGTCVKGEADDGAVCDDGKSCTTGDVCTGGTCGGQVDCDDGNPCTADECGDNGDCLPEDEKPALNGEVCDDGNACTENDSCNNFGSCAGTALDCDDGEACTEDGCLAAEGCKNEPVAEGTACTDGDACTTGDACDAAGTCVSGEAKVCDDNNECTTDSCDPASDCKFEPLKAGSACDDGDACTEKDACTAAAKCEGETLAAVNNGNPCEQGTCTEDANAPDGFVIDFLPLPEGTPCNDGDACTVQDTCNAIGQCQAITKPCDDSNTCTEDSCDAATGECVNAPVAENTDCNDGNACTFGDKCEQGVCSGVAYQQSGDCDDGKDCTSDGCQPKTGCFHTPVSGPACNDGDACTNADKCETGSCKGLAKVCDDGKLCTNDSCDPVTGQCQHEAFIGPCDDNNPCTTGDVCGAAGQCTGKSAQETGLCDDGNDCTLDICDAVQGCTNVPKQPGTACDDGLACTTIDICSNGECVPAKQGECVSCNSDLECLPFDDGNACNGTLGCVSTPGGKVCDVKPGTVVVCDPSNNNDCQQNTCDPGSGQCLAVFKADGQKCEDGDACTTKTFCTNGQCGGQDVVCDDEDECTADSCDAQAGCQFEPIAAKEGQACNDGDVCTPNETCKSGVCTATQNTCACLNDAQCEQFDDGNLCNGIYKCLPNPNGGGTVCQLDDNTKVTCDPLVGDECKENVCDPGTGTCAPAPVENGELCDDGNACSLAESCQGGVCTSNQSQDCDDNSECTIDLCDSVFGCVNAPGQNVPCDDGDSCTENDVCVSGVCGGQALDCDDGNPCTLNLCDKNSGQCSAILDDNLPCDDGNPCTLGDKCLAGFCTADALKCDDGNECTVDGCDGQGGCKNILVDGKDCDDGDACSTGDKCLAGQCIGNVKNCDDNNPCTSESCGANGVCAITPLTGQACDDGNLCTEEDACQANGQCKGVVFDCVAENECQASLGCAPALGCQIVSSDGKACSDDDACTFDDICAGGGCQGKIFDCDDSNPCTVDSCDSETGCVNKQNTCDDNNDCTFDTCDQALGCQYEPINGKKCDDGDACTENGGCQQDTCVSSAVDCDDNNPCTIDTCDAETGCVYLPEENTATACDDGDVCTEDTCDGQGSCVGVAIDCDDGNSCTINVCNPISGCITQQVSDDTPCDDGNECTANDQCLGGTCEGGKGVDDFVCNLCPTGEDSECNNLLGFNNLCTARAKCVTDDPKYGFNYCVPDLEPVVCNTIGDSQCVKNTCSPVTGECSMTELVNGSACDDGLGCTAGDTCSNGECQGAAPTDCSGAADQCNEGACVEAPGTQAGYECVSVPLEGTVTCDADGSGCTANDKCDGQGTCVAGPEVSCDGVAGDCEIAACKSTGVKSFTCEVTPAPDGFECDDGQLCTVGDQCQAGQCQAGPLPYDCSDLNSVCAIGECDANANGGTGACVPKAQNDGKLCNSDASGCTVDDVCVNGLCIPGAPPDCSVNNTTCATGACQSTGGNSFKCIGAPKADNLPCEADDDGCTVGDACKSGICQAGPAKDCSALDGNDGCVIGTCQSLGPAANTCVQSPAPKDTPCNADDNGCTQNDYCTGDGACTPGVAVSCLDFTGACAQGECGSTGTNTFSCSGDPKPDGTACDADGDGCTENDVCQSGICQTGAAIDCSDLDSGVCIVGECFNKGSDQYECLASPKSNDTACDADGDGCTKDDQCFDGTCTAGELETCIDFVSLCANAVCGSTGANSFNCNVDPIESYKPLDPPVACTPTVDKPAGDCPLGYDCASDGVGQEGLCQPSATVFCDDGDACTIEDICAAGICTGGTDKDCDDGDPCTNDVCVDGVCDNIPVPGCSICIDEGFEEDVFVGWKIDNDEESYMKWELSTAKVYEGLRSMHVEWSGAKPNGADGFVEARARYRGMYISDGDVTPILTFQLGMDVALGGCDGNDDLMLFINGAKAWEKCDSNDPLTVVGGFEPVEIDLSQWAGAPVELEFVAITSGTAEASGVIDIDNLRLSGQCNGACLRSSFDIDISTETNEILTDTNPIPQPWSLSSEASSYVGWVARPTALEVQGGQPPTGHTGTGFVAVTYSGAHVSGTAKKATIRIPKTTPIQGDTLHFALNAPVVGNDGCSEDTLTVNVNGQELYKRCNKTNGWIVEDLPLGSFANQEITITFVVTTAAGANAAGDWRLDDIAISGGCQYACLFADFDDEGFSEFNLTSTSPANLQWELQQGVPAKANSQPNSARLLWDSSVPAEKYADISLKSQYLRNISLGSAIWSIDVNAFLKSPTCVPEEANQFDFYLARGGAVGNPTADPPSENYVDLNAGVCESTVGWQTLTGELAPEDLGEGVTFGVAALVSPANDTAEIYVDNLAILCK